VRRARPTSAQKVLFLKSPSTFGPAARAVRAIETHFAWVFLAGREAYKLKKPLRHMQLDYRSLAARKRGCLEELRLNRRLAPDVYLSVVPLTFVNGRLRLGGSGEVVDWLIRMRRLPDAQMLNQALPRGTVRADQIDRVSEALVRFYSRADARPMSGQRYVARLAHEIRANVNEICRYADRLTQRSARDVGEMQLRALNAIRPLLAARAAHIVEGHGDLRAEHVHLGRHVAIIDALEFDEQLRLLDPAEEVSLLALEIERLGPPQLADRLIERFRRDLVPAAPPQVFSFYKSHRAATRAKLAAWHIGDPQYRDAGPWIARTESLLADALRYAQAACGDASTTDRRPSMQKRGEGRAGDHATYGFGEEWGHMQFR
jgi:aminoglycoside phosphotransferase family enzyme